MFENVDSILEHLKRAKLNLDHLREQYIDKPILLQIYEPSAKELIRTYEVELQQYLKIHADVELSLKDKKNVDFWVRIEGKSFQEGRGPIEFIGDYLQKLDASCKKVLSILGSNINQGTKDSIFYLADTDTGSLKLGLKKNLYEVDEKIKEETDLFGDADVSWTKMKTLIEREDEISKSLELLFEAMESVDSEEKLDRLKRTLADEGKLIKLLSYAKDLTPSRTSYIDNISFEYSSDINKHRVIRVNSDTRKTLLDYSKKLLNGNELVNGIALIRSQDMDKNRVIARPLRFGNKSIDDLECNLPEKYPAENYLDKFVNITGVLVYGKDNKPSRLCVDTINIKENTDNEDE